MINPLEILLNLLLLYLMVVGNVFVSHRDAVRQSETKRLMRRDLLLAKRAL